MVDKSRLLQNLLIWGNEEMLSLASAKQEDGTSSAAWVVWLVSREKGSAMRGSEDLIMAER